MDIFDDIDLFLITCDDDAFEAFLATHCTEDAA